MNLTLATGYLVKDAWSTVQPGTYRQILCFDLMLTGRDGKAVPWRCELDDEGEAKRVGPKLVAGAGVIVGAELAGRAWSEHGVQKGFTRYLAVTHVEFSRVLAQTAPAAAGSETT